MTNIDLAEKKAENRREIDKFIVDYQCRSRQGNPFNRKLGGQEQCEESSHRKSGYIYFFIFALQFKVGIHRTTHPVTAVGEHKIFSGSSMTGEAGYGYSKTGLIEPLRKVLHLISHPGESMQQQYGLVVAALVIAGHSNGSYFCISRYLF